MGIDKEVDEADLDREEQQRIDSAFRRWVDMEMQGGTHPNTRDRGNASRFEDY